MTKVLVTWPLQPHTMFRAPVDRSERKALTPASVQILRLLAHWQVLHHLIRRRNYSYPLHATGTRSATDWTSRQASQ